MNLSWRKRLPSSKQQDSFVSLNSRFLRLPLDLHTNRVSPVFIPWSVSSPTKVKSVRCGHPTKEKNLHNELKDKKAKMGVRPSGKSYSKF